MVAAGDRHMQMWSINNVYNYRCIVGFLHKACLNPQYGTQKKNQLCFPLTLKILSQPFLSSSARVQRGPGPPHHCGFSITYNDTSQWLDSSGRVISSSQRPLLDNTQLSRLTEVSPAVFEAAVTASKQPHTLALDRSAARPLGSELTISSKMHRLFPCLFRFTRNTLNRF